MWYVYKITNQTDTYHYIGITENIEKRLIKHNGGATRSTRPYRPFNKVEILKEVLSRIEARKWEKYFKSGIGRQQNGV